MPWLRRRGERRHTQHGRRAGGDGITARVVLLEPAGPLTWVVADLDGVRLKARLAEGACIVPGAEARLAFRAEAAHLFDAASGLRLEP